MRTLKIIFFLITIVFTPFIVDNVVGLEREIYFIKIKISKRTLTILKNNIESNQYPIAVPYSNWYPLPLKGKIIKIEYNPVWYPTFKTRIAYYKKRGVRLPAVVGPNSPQNAMGRVKFIIQFENFDQPIRLHGTNQPNSIGKRVTRGCIRMSNDDALELAKIIEEKLPVSLVVE